VRKPGDGTGSWRVSRVPAMLSAERLPAIGRFTVRLGGAAAPATVCAIPVRMHDR
jgi:hypothetical protein